MRRELEFSLSLSLSLSLFLSLLTKLSGQRKFYFNFILMKITAPRRRAINFSGNMAARASDANNRAIKRPCFSAKEETELSSLRTQISQLKYSTANRTADASRTERRSRYLYLVARLSERKLNALKEKRKKHTQEGAGGRNRKRSGEV